MAFSLKLFVFASLCICTVLSYQCNQAGLKSAFASGGTFFLSNCPNPPVVILTETLTVSKNFTFSMNGVILRSVNFVDAKFGLKIINSNFNITNGVIEVPVSLKSSSGTITSVNVRNFTATGEFHSSIWSEDSTLTLLRSSTYLTTGDQGTIYVKGGKLICQLSSLIFNAKFTGAAFSLENIVSNSVSEFDSCTITGNDKFSMKGSNFLDFSLVETRNTIWDINITEYVSTFFGDYNVFKTEKQISYGIANIYGAVEIFSEPIESPNNFYGHSLCGCVFATAWVPLADCSPAIDLVGAGASQFTKDQNGNKRELNGAVDAGAIESYLLPCLSGEVTKIVTQCVNTVDITLTLSSKSAANVSVVYATKDGTAKAGIDFVEQHGIAVFAAGTDKLVISIKLIRNIYSKASDQKSFQVLFSSVVNANLHDAITNIKLKCAVPLTTSAITTHALTSGIVTTGQVTSAKMTTHKATTSKMTTDSFTSGRPLTTDKMTTAAMTTAELTTSQLTTLGLTTSPGLTTSYLTTNKVIVPYTTGDMKLTTSYVPVSNETNVECDPLTLICSLGYCKDTYNFTVDDGVYSYSDFNAISFGDFYLDNGDTEGRLLVQGSFYAAKDGISIGDKLEENSFPYSAIIGRDAVFVNGRVYPDGAGIFVGSKFTGADYIKGKVSGYCPKAGCLDQEFTEMKEFYLNASRKLATLEDTASYVLWYQQLNITCKVGSSIHVININATTFSTVTDYALFECPSTSLFLFNIKGNETVVFQGKAIATPATLYNIVDGANVYINATVSGSILAPSSNYEQTAGYVEGQVVVGNNTATVQINLPGCANASIPISVTSEGGDFIQSSDAALTVFSFVLAVIMSLVIML